MDSAQRQNGRRYRLRNETSGQAVADYVMFLKSPGAQAIGLLGRSSLDATEGVWLSGTGSVHTFGMRFAIDIVFVDASGRVTGVKGNVSPWRVAMAPRGTRSAIELAAGRARDCPVGVGDVLRLEEAE